MGELFFPQPYLPYDAINAFFCYSFLGWVMECIVIRHEKGAWENRGFARAPFCVIYGFGAMLGYVILRPFSGNLFVLGITGAVIASALEYVTARLMLRLFGTFWWDYTNKPFNYRGILCLESTIGWGVIAVLLFVVLHRAVFFAVRLMPYPAAAVLAAGLVCWYSIDFALCMKKALAARAQEKSRENDTTLLPG